MRIGIVGTGTDVGELSATRHLERLGGHLAGLGMNADRLLKILQRS